MCYCSLHLLSVNFIAPLCFYRLSIDLLTLVQEHAQLASISFSKQLRPNRRGEPIHCLDNHCSRFPLFISSSLFRQLYRVAVIYLKYDTLFLADLNGVQSAFFCPELTKKKKKNGE